MEDILKDRAMDAAMGAAESVAGKVVDAIQSLVDGDSTEVQFRIRFPKASAADWYVRGVVLNETVGEPYECAIEISTQDAGVRPGDLLGQDAELVFERVPLKQRLVGIVSRVEQGRTSDRYTTARVYVVPALAALAHRRNTRMFQDATVVEILQQVLGEGLAPFEREADVSRLGREYLKREYTVQYQETDLSFVTRLMEEEGIAYTFDHAGNKERCILVEENANFGPITTMEGGNRVKLVPMRGELGDSEPVYRFELRRELGPTAVAAVDYDWTAPGRVTEPREGQDAQGRVREVYDHERGLTFTEYDEGTKRYGRNDLSLHLTRLMESLRASQALGFGEGRVTGFRAGHVFELTDHPQASLNGRYLITRVEHVGKPPEPGGGVGEALLSALSPGAGEQRQEEEARYSNRFECLPVDIVYRRGRTTQKPRIHGVQTATVVGPQGEEIHTDPHGRIKVQFHWDREGDLDDRSSCFVRVAQGWAGAGWGCTFIPRVGMEVVVTFVDGDPDRPIVTGCLYNGAHVPPYALPGEMSKTTIKTQSTPGGGGFNELRFEDKKGSEEVFLHAQKTHTVVVQGSESVSVGGAQSVSVSGTREKTVTKDETNTLRANRITRITQADTLEVGQGATETVKTGTKKVDVQSGALEMAASTKVMISQTPSHFLKLEGKSELKSATNVNVEAGEQAACVWADNAGNLTLKANACLKLQCGGASIELTSGGKITVKGVEVHLVGPGGKVVANAAGTSVSGGAVNVEATGNTVIKGAIVQIN